MGDFNHTFFPTPAVTYEPLHHKYRPQTFADLVGQEAIATTLTNAIRTQRIAPAYLLTGSRGTGKTSSARILAKSLNCLKNDKPTEYPCGVCEACVSITKGYALDVMEIDAASNTGVDNIRELIEKAQFAPVQCRYKVYVVDECHQLSSAAFNALLKTLEEPPKQVVFVLATTDPQRVLPTIISRCQRFDFRRIPLAAMVKHLHKIADLEQINITSEAITLLAQVAQGGLRDAQSLLDQLSLLTGEVTVERIWDLVGAVPERDLMELLAAIASDNPEAVLEKTRNLMDRGKEPLSVLQNLAGFYRDLLIAKTAPNRNDLVAVTAPTWKAMCEFIHGWETATILTGQKYLKDSEIQIKNTTQPRLWLEVTLLGLLPSANVVSLQKDSSTTAVLKVSQNHPPQPSQNWTTHQQHTAHSNAQESKKATNGVSPPQLTSPAPVKHENSEPAANGYTNREHAVGTTPTDSQEASEHAHAVRVSQAVSVPQAAQEMEASAGTAEQSELEQIWEQVLTLLQPPATQVLLRQHCHLLAFDKNVAVACIGISSQPLLKLATSKLPNIEAAFEQIFKHKVKVNFQVNSTAESKTPPTRERRTSKPSQPLNKESTHNNSVNSPNQSSSKNQSFTGMEAPKASFMPESPLPPAQQPSASQTSDTEAGEVAISENGQSQEADEVITAAQSFAKFFNAEMIDLSDGFEKNIQPSLYFIEDRVSRVDNSSLMIPNPEPSTINNQQSPTEPIILPRDELELEDEDDVPF